MPVSRRLNTTGDKPVVKPKPVKRPTTRQTKPKEVVSRTGVTVKEIYCRRCMKTKIPAMFYQAVDSLLDKNGYFSVCSDCCNEVYNNFYNENHSVEKSLLKTCRALNIRYDESAVQATNDTLFKYLEREKETEKTFGVYKSKLMKLQNTRITDRNMNEDFTFYEPSISVTQNPMKDDETDNAAELKQFWGNNFEYDDYVWLEREFSEWKKTHKIDTRSEVSLLKMIVLKLFDIRKARAEGREASGLEKNFQDLLKTSALSPAQSNVASQGKSQDTFGLWIKDIEDFGPAEWWDKRRDQYVDAAGFGKYCEDYITRPISNFFGVSKNFDISDDEGFSDDIEDTDIIGGEDYADIN